MNEEEKIIVLLKILKIKHLPEKISKTLKHILLKISLVPFNGLSKAVRNVRNRVNWAKQRNIFEIKNLISAKIQNKKSPFNYIKIRI